MHSRKEFVRVSGLGLLGLFTKHGAEGATLVYEPEKLEALPWKEIGKAFDLDPEMIYMNNGTMGPSPMVVYEKMFERIRFVNREAKYGGGDHECVAAVAKFVGANKDEIALTHNVTEGINIAVWGAPLKKGDEVILSTHEHVGNAAPWLNRKRLDGICVKGVPYGKTADETLSILKNAVTRKTRVIAIPHIPCTIGQVAPMKEICNWARSKGIMTLVDGAHGTGMMNLDLHDMGCDVYASCFHKWLLGPKGTGYIYVRKDFQEKLESLYTGGYSSGDWVIDEEKSEMKNLTDDAHKYYYGTQNSALYFGIMEAIKFHQTYTSQAIENRIRALNDYLFGKLKEVKKVEILTPEEPISRCGVVSFRFKDFSNRTFYDKTHKDKMIVRYVAESNLDCIRVSTHIYNQENQIDTLVEQIHGFAG